MGMKALIEARDAAFKKFQSDTVEYGLMSKQSKDARALYKDADSALLRARRADPAYKSPEERFLGAIFGDKK